jgi:transposase-like protein
MSTTDEITEVQAKPIEEVQAKGIACVSHCPLCGVELEYVALTNRFYRCKSCNGAFLVKTLEE